MLLWSRETYRIQIRKCRPLIWIVSYPRSGNTFVRAVLANYLANADAPLSLDEIVASSLGEHNQRTLLELTGKMPEDRTLVEEVAVRPAYFARERAESAPAAVMMKSHTLFCQIEGLPTFAFEPGDRVIHLVRHPCDVAISYGHYFGIGLDEAIKRLLTDGLFHQGHPDMGYEVTGSWSQHTRAWMQDVGAPVCRVRYSDMLTHPVEVLLQIAEFLGIDVDAERADRATRFARFDRLKHDADRSGFSENNSHSGETYFRDGRAGQWLDAMSVSQVRRIMDHDPELIELLGFERVWVA